MGIPLDTEDAARVLVDGHVRPVDLIVDELGGVVVNNVHVGAGAQASRRGARWKERLGKIGYGRLNLGRAGYPIGALLAAVRPPFLRLRVEVDGEVVVDLDHPVLMVAIGNGPTVGGGAELAPEADPEDGKVDVMISRAIGPWARLAYAAHLTRGRHHERDDVIYLRGERVSISGEEFYCAADGEVYGPERNRTWHVEPAAYSMVLP
jgi:diacylglycerol kinase (ATP)